ncbi:MAG: hypothetical protein ORN29_00360, partial [Rhodoferax sp.]|nr:hypothetical protein [Rhodoferax sp.]
MVKPNPSAARISKENHHILSEINGASELYLPRRFKKLNLASKYDTRLIPLATQKTCLIRLQQQSPHGIDIQRLRPACPGPGAWAWFKTKRSFAMNTGKQGQRFPGQPIRPRDALHFHFRGCL